MQFITESDLLGKIKENVLEDILEIDSDISGSTVLDQIEKTALDEIHSYIGHYYDTSIIFSQSGDTRDQFIVKMVIDIMLYEISSKLTPASIPEIRQIRYDQVKTDMLNISSGKIVPNLPIRDQETQSNSGIYFTYEEKNNVDF